MTTQDISPLIHEWLAAWTGGEADKLLQFYSDDIHYIDPAHPEGIEGIEQLEQYLTKLLSKNPDWVWTAEEIIPNPAGCTLRWKAQIPIHGEIVTLRGLDIVEIKDYRITRNEVYFDRTPWLETIQRSKK